VPLVDISGGVFVSLVDTDGGVLVPLVAALANPETSSAVITNKVARSSFFILVTLFS
jgi:hypothetical protein